MDGDFEGFVSAISAASKEITRIKTNEMRRFGLKATDVMVLYHLEREPEGITASELARRIGVDRAMVSRTLSGLVEGGFVSAPAGSGRYKAPVRLTEKGVRTTYEVEQIIEEMVGRAVEGISPEDRAIMRSSLVGIVENLKQMSVD